MRVGERQRGHNQRRAAGCWLAMMKDEGAHVRCQSGLRPRDTPLGHALGLILFLFHFEFIGMSRVSRFRKTLAKK